MNFEEFVEQIDFPKKTELDKVIYTAFYLRKVEEQRAFSIVNVLDKLSSIGHPISNVSRIKSKISKSRKFKQNGSKVEYILSADVVQVLNIECTCFLDDKEKIDSNSELLDESLFIGHRGYLDKLIWQINACYKYNLYDGCAVLMRRVFEVLLILSFEANGIQNEIKDDNGDYMMLEKIVAKAIGSTILNISRSKKGYNSVRDLGNFAAHKIHFNTKKKDIDDLTQIYRVILEELLYKSKLIK